MPNRTHIVTFFLINLFLASWFLDTGHNDNVMSRAAFVASVTHHGTWSIDRYHEYIGDKALIEGKHYSDKAPLPSFMVLPAYWLASQLGLVADSSESISDGLLRLGGFICGSIPFALIVTLLWLRMRTGRNLHGSKWMAMLVMLGLYGSFLFVYAGSFQAHVLATAFMLLAALGLEKKHFILAGFLAGCAFLCEYTLLVIPGIWGLQLWFRKDLRNSVLLGLGLLPTVVLVLWHNQVLTGDALTFPYKYLVNFPTLKTYYGFRLPSLESLWGLSFSPYRGLFFYAPVLLVLFFIQPFSSFKVKRFLTHPLVLPAGFLFLIISTHSTWWGGWTYGPRYLMATAGLLLLYTAGKVNFRAWQKILFLTFALFGMACSLLSKFTIWYDLPTGVLNPFQEKLLPALADGNFSSRTGISEWIDTSNAVRAYLFLPLFSLGLFLAFQIDKQGFRSVKH